MAINHLLLGIHGKDKGCVHKKGLQKTDGPKGIMGLLTAELFTAHLIAGITKLAQASSRYYTNQVETANNIVKDWLGFSNKLIFPVAICQTEEYVAAQQQEFEIAIYGNGPYEIAESHAHLRKTRHM